MNNWSILNKEEYTAYWNFIYNSLYFVPNLNSDSLITLPMPNRCFDISQFYGKGFDDNLYNNLHDTAIKWFEKISGGQRMFALEWQHECYSFDPKGPFEKDEFNEWLIPVFPNGEYLFFLTKNFENGIFADGINLRLSMWGEAIIKESRSSKAEILIKSQEC